MLDGKDRGYTALSEALNSRLLFLFFESLELILSSLKLSWNFSSWAFIPLTLLTCKNFFEKETLSKFENEISQWHSLSREEQSIYYEKARQERQLHMELYPGWSARDNYGYGSKKKKRKKDRSPADSGGITHCFVLFIPIFIYHKRKMISPSFPSLEAFIELRGVFLLFMVSIWLNF